MTGRKRPVRTEEQALFEDTLRDVQPLVKRMRPAEKPSVEKTKPAAAAPPEPASQKAASFAGIDGNTAGRLSRGQLEPKARLDLHGMTESVAHLALVTFLRSASVRKLKLVLVVTGKGRKPPSLDEPFVLDSGARGVLRGLTPRWLAEPELARFVADVRPSHRRHGGDGALYVYLRKSR